MHGRIKVRTSEEEKARKERERQEKLKVFKYAIQQIQNKMNQDELDKDLLDLTGKVLSSNPDIYTLWNIRRKILLFYGNQEGMTEEMTQIYDTELQLTEYCLKNNPKSYCAWHQREWVLITRPDPDWKKELDICNMYLKFDERNFHTWDYRRFVVVKCKHPLEDEFEFTTEKLLDNFSNYSAWHYRSKMLVELYPDLEGGRPIEDCHHKHELKMVQSAAFTDPDDTSAWFYQRWLLGAVKKTISLVVVAVINAKTTLAFSDYVSEEFIKSKILVMVENKVIHGDWSTCTGNQYDVVWIFKHKEIITNGLQIKVEYKENDTVIKIIDCIESGPKTYIGKTDVDFKKNYSKPVIEELNNQLDSCRQLLTLEPDNKWTLLTTLVFLHCIDPRKNHKEVIENLHTLTTIDKLRAGYYEDLISKWSIEDVLPTSKSDNVFDLEITFNEKLTCLPHLQFYSHCVNVDLSNQKLTSKVLPTLIVLQHCKKLNLQNNQLTTLKSFPILDLEEIDLRGNQELDQKEVQLFKEKCNYNVIF